MSKQEFLSVAEALARVLAPATPLVEEMVVLREARGRTLARDLTALRTQPPADLSAMDGYALRHEDLVDLDRPLRLAGESAAGRRHEAPLQVGRDGPDLHRARRCPRAPNTILIQEMAGVEGSGVVALERPAKGRNIRKAGLDFAEGEVLLTAGTRLDAARDTRWPPR